MILGYVVILALTPCAARGETGWVVDTLDAAVHVRGLSLAIDSMDGLHVSYSDRASHAIVYGTFRSGVWTTETLPDTGSWNSIAVTRTGEPSVAFTRDGRAWFAWREGDLWMTEVIDSVLDACCGAIPLALDPEGSPHVCFWGGGLYDYYAEKTGSAWSVEMINVGGGAEDWAWVEIGSDGEPRVVYPEYSHYFEYSRLVFGAREESLWQRETGDSTNWWHWTPVLALDGSDLPHIAYGRYYLMGDEEFHACYMTKTAEGSWVHETIESVTRDYEMGWNNFIDVSDIGVDDGGNPHILYRKHIDSTGVNTDTLFHAWKQGAVWCKERVAGAITRRASLALDSQGGVHVLYGGPSPQYGLYLARRCESTGTGGADSPRSGVRLAIAPNPLRTGMGTISFELPVSCNPSLTIYDTRGRIAAERCVGLRSAGLHTLEWDGRDAQGLPVAPGVYFARLRAGEHVAVRKMLLVR
jgi:hypothetical protein